MNLQAFDYAQKKNNFLLWVASKHHRTHKREVLDFKHHKYLRSVYLDKSPYLIIRKSTQCGVSEYLIVKALSKPIEYGFNVFYVLPTYHLVNRFVRNRVDKCISYSRYYSSQVKLAKEQSGFQRSESMTLKDLGDGSIAFTGSNSTVGFTEYPADLAIIDELDECDQENIKMAWERLSHSEYREEIKVANPTIEGFGIDEEFLNSDQKLWFIKHDCGKWINLDWFKHVVKKIGENDYLIRDKTWTWNCGRDIYPICHSCGKPIDRKGAGKWVRTAQNYKSGYHISKLFSGSVTIVEILDRFQKGLVNDSVMQRFYNGDLGLAFTAAGAKITAAMLDSCIKDYRMEDYSSGVCVAGVDVGAKLHIRISEIMMDKTLKAVYIGSVERKEDLFEVLKEYKIKAGVIDAAPETRLSKEVCAKMKGIWLRCYYHQSKTDVVNLKDKSISVDRTQALDAVKEYIVTERLWLPKNARSISEYYDQMVASTRIFKELKQKYVWEEGNKADHFFHAEAYNLLAKRVIMSYTK